MPDAVKTGLDALDRRLIVATQGGLPRVSRPFDAIGKELGIGGDEVIVRLQHMLDTGVIRRIGAVPNHYAIGYTANGMSVWDVDDARIDELGALVGALGFVTHCYRRPRLEGWRYNLFAMVHGMNAEQIEYERNLIRDQLGDACRADTMLVSSRILKKTGLRLAAQRQEK